VVGRASLFGWRVIGAASYVLEFEGSFWRGKTMAGRGPQTFKKKQKEQQRKEKREEKMAKRLERKKQQELGLPVDPDLDDQPDPDHPELDRPIPMLGNDEKL
jgi:hypothetical protein